MFFFLNRFETGGEPAQVLVAIRILHFVISREQDLIREENPTVIILKHTFLRIQ